MVVVERKGADRCLEARRRALSGLGVRLPKIRQIVALRVIHMQRIGYETAKGLSIPGVELVPWKNSWSYGCRVLLARLGDVQGFRRLRPQRGSADVREADRDLKCPWLGVSSVNAERYAR